MQNKRTIFVMGILVLLVGVAAFVAGKMLNNQINPLTLFGLKGKGGTMAISANVIPAEELPKTSPEGMGSFVERKDNTIVLQPIPLHTGAGGVVKPDSEAEAAVGAPADLNSAPVVEIVVTNETIIYQETTQLSGPPSGETETIQQTVEESTLDHLDSQSMVTVWGRKKGDRIIAEVLLYSNPVFFKRP
jgi:hypothetical protein